jgi:hypothetical protein
LLRHGAGSASLVAEMPTAILVNILNIPEWKADLEFSHTSLSIAKFHAGS